MKDAAKAQLYKKIFFNFGTPFLVALAFYAPFYFTAEDEEPVAEAVEMSASARARLKPLQEVIITDEGAVAVEEEEVVVIDPFEGEAFGSYGPQPEPTFKDKFLEFINYDGMVEVWDGIVGFPRHSRKWLHRELEAVGFKVKKERHFPRLRQSQQTSTSK